jgi:hypothetical protein
MPCFLIRTSSSLRFITKATASKLNYEIIQRLEEMVVE